jgi:short-subunit dehydrogenase
MEIRNKVVLITGASEGIGAACVSAFRARGARLVLTARSRQKLERIAKPGDLIIAADLQSPADRTRLIEDTFAQRGGVDVLINNAGIGLYSPAYLCGETELRSLFEVNFFAPLHLAQLAAVYMRQRRSGHIVNVSSIGGKVTLPWMTLYSASKYATCSVTDGLRMELAPFGIQVTAVCPVYVRTDFQSHALKGGRPPARVAALRRLGISTERCAARIVRGVERNSRTLVIPRWGWLFVAAARLFPRAIDFALTRRKAAPEAS